MNQEDIQNLDRQHNWHPCTHPAKWLDSPPWVVEGAQGDYLYLSDGRRVIDGISSWWCKVIGHRHPRLREAMLEQIHAFEHVIYADITYEKVVTLSQQLCQLNPGATRVFYAGDGASSIEIALKMSLHSRFLTGERQRTRFMALRQGYHGETLGALSVSDLGLYKNPYHPLLFQPILIDPPYLSQSLTEGEIEARVKRHWQELEPILEEGAKEVTALILEPLIQGAGGMRIYPALFLKTLVEWAQGKGIHVIADEIMTGLGRTGHYLASHQADISPDMVCLSKALTGGWLPFSAVMLKESLFEIFAEAKPGQHFTHSHTYSGNPLGVSLALATLAVLKEEQLVDRAKQLEIEMRRGMERIGQDRGFIENIRGMGAVMAGDISVELSDPAVGQVARIAMEKGVLLRPIGRTLYWLPPLNISEEALNEMMAITKIALLQAQQGDRHSNHLGG